MQQQNTSVTGMNIVSPVGRGNAIFFNALTNALDGITGIAAFREKGHRTSKAALIKDFSQEAGKESITAWLIHCINGALEQSRLTPGELAGKRVKLILGTFLGELGANKVGADFYNPPFDETLREVNDHFRFTLPPLLIASACASGLQAIGAGKDLLESGEADIVIAGAYEALGDFVFSGMNLIKALADEICPFDENRKGTIIGEGAGVIILEREKEARERGASVLCYVAGCASFNDAFHLLRPHPEAVGIKKAMKRSLQAAGIETGDVDCILAHGTGTRYNDLYETMAIREVFGEFSREIPVTSIKSAIGHTLGAAGIMSVITAVLSINAHIIPPVVNLQNRDRELDLFFVKEKALKKEVNCVVCNALGFGGVNSAIVLTSGPPPLVEKEAPGVAPSAGLRTLFVTEARVRDIDGFELSEKIIPCCRKLLVSRPAGEEGNTGIIFDAGSGRLGSQKLFWEEVLSRGVRRASPTLFCQSFPGFPAGEICQTLGISGPSLTICDSTASLKEGMTLARYLLGNRLVEEVLLIKAFQEKVYFLLLDCREGGVNLESFAKENFELPVFDKSAGGGKS